MLWILTEHFTMIPKCFKPTVLSKVFPILNGCFVLEFDEIYQMIIVLVVGKIQIVYIILIFDLAVIGFRSEYKHCFIFGNLD